MKYLEVRLQLRKKKIFPRYYYYYYYYYKHSRYICTAIFSICLIINFNTEFVFHGLTYFFMSICIFLLLIFRPAGKFRSLRGLKTVCVAYCSLQHNTLGSMLLLLLLLPATQTTEQADTHPPSFPHRLNNTISWWLLGKVFRYYLNFPSS